MQVINKLEKMNSPAPSALRLDYTCAVIAQKQGEEKIPTTNM